MTQKTARSKKPSSKVAPSSRATNVSTSGFLRVSHSRTHSRSINASMSRRSFSLAGDGRVLEKAPMQPARATVKVFDENGTDVTPQPLYRPDPAAVPPRQSKILMAQDVSGATFSDFFSSAFHTTYASFGGPFTRSLFESSIVSKSSQSTMESLNEEIEEPSSKREGIISLSDVQVRREEVKEPTTEDVLNKKVDIHLTETETLCLLDIPATSVSVESEEAEIVKQRNAAYTELCKNRMGNDKYVERAMQTFNGAPKAKEVQTKSITKVDAAITATNWDIYDTLSGTGVEGVVREPPETEESNLLDIMSNHSQESSRNLERSMSFLSHTPSSSSSRTEMEVFLVPVEDAPAPEVILYSEKFQQDLLVMEKVVLQNIFQPKLAAYRQLPILKDPDSTQKPKDTGKTEKQIQKTEDIPSSPALEPLWSFTCELTVGRNVSSMTWNKMNPDLLAVGYGHFDFEDQKSGLVCCWSLKNLKWPDRIFHCESAVTALDFSGHNGCLLAVGMHNGSIATYNVQSKEKTPITDSSEYPHKHTGPVWQVKWVSQERAHSEEEKGEALVSVSADGRICKWVLKKDLDCVDLMKLKRTKSERTRRQLGERERRSELVIWREVPGLCFDFHPEDSNIYLTGTEEGFIHKCSCSYNEQYLETYKEHKGPVYQITWSPFSPDVFLSCSSDWTIQLWRQDLLEPVLVFTSPCMAVFDVAWSPKWATVFGVVTEKRLEIWDLGASILDPTIVQDARPGVKLTSLQFASESDCILLGDSDGQVGVYQLNLNLGEGTQVNKTENTQMKCYT
ncbi:dynein axonemal intermediate chain 4 isoform X2 [Scleropages formosus]|uniref:dynein axonemal intermediate chain 4 isoform X2 n=1 Tax=Scleropages formosus TaxID=113540 RepID=UPI0008784BDC|nr:WD repeat-containing protein 78 isoform X2 [Scleropages formosus]